MTALFALLPVERLGWVLIHSLWQFLLIALVVRLLEQVFAGRTHASARYLAGVSGLAAMTAAPVVTWYLAAVTPLADAGPAAPGAAVERMQQPRREAAAQPGRAIRGPTSSSDHVMDQPRADNSLTDTLSAGWRTFAIRLRPWLPILVTGWVAGMSVCSLRPLLGWLMLHRLGTVGAFAGGPVLGESVPRIAARLGMTRTVSVLRSTLAKTPLVIGYLRPVLLVPVDIVAQLPLKELEAILAHELAHIHRHDFLVNLWQISLETVFFYHPAVWSLSRRLRVEREHCCDDIALSVIGDPVCYGRALLHVEELCAPEPLLALGASGSSLPNRIRRLIGQPTPRHRAAGLIAAMLLPGIALTCALGMVAWAAGVGNDQQAAGNVPQKSQPAPAAQPRPNPAARSLDIVIAKHVIVWDGRIRTWDEVVTELREIRKARGKPIHPHFLFTNGAHSAGRWDTYHAKLFEIYKELFEPAGMSLGSISPRASPRYDAIQKALDLVPDPKSLRSGVVVEKGQPKGGVLVVLVPEKGMMPVVLKPDLTLRDPHDEVWTITGPDGRFTLPVQPVHALDKPAPPPTYALAAISGTGFGLAGIPAEGEKATIDLLPLARVELAPVEGKPQRIDVALRGGLPDPSPGFWIYEIELRDKRLSLNLPPGKITIYRAFSHQDGSSQSYPDETLRIGPGGVQEVKVPNLTEDEAARIWRESSLRPKRDLNKPKEK
ncbi:MAG TPA: M56 family metallopeptidase [Gemmataceae bacterium]|nr:M56 family metallopeptidase [Gemmataceae bacterium]